MSPLVHTPHPVKQPMTAIQITPIENLKYYVEIIFCKSLAQMSEFAIGYALDDNDESVFILNMDDSDDMNRVGTILFLEDALQPGTIVHQATRAGLAFGELMSGLAGTFEGDDDQTEYFHSQVANVAQTIFNTVGSFVMENYEA